MKLRNWILAALFAALTAVGSLIKIPTPISSFSPLFFFTAISAILLGPKYGALSQLIYVLLGLSGLPIFTTGGGLTYVLTPTFGFLIGLVPAAIVIGLLIRRLGNGFWALCLSCLFAWVPFLKSVSAGISIVACTVAAAAICAALFPIPEEEVVV